MSDRPASGEAEQAAPETPVLIVGGGPVGLAMALELAYQGVHSTLVERAESVSSELLAKAGTLSARTLEFCRRWGIADQVSNWGADPDFPRDTCYVTALVGGHFIGRAKVASARERREDASPEMLRKCPQHVFDPILAEAVESAGATTLGYGTELVALQQDATGVSCRLRSVRSGQEQTLRASYVVGCDGAASRVRTQLGIDFEGPTLDYSVSAILRVPDLDRYHPIGKATRYIFVGPQGAWANLTSVDYGELWRFTLLGSEARLPVEQLDLRQKIVTAFGRDDIPFELMRALPWRRSQCTASRYRSGRVLLAGDAAHTTSPTGGHGLNTGLADVVGLGWLLAARLQGWGGEGMLDAYEFERRAIAVRNGRSSTRNYEAWTGGDLDLSGVLDDGPQADAARVEIGEALNDKLREEWHADGVRMGYRYEGSPLIVPDGTPEPFDDMVSYVPTARPGHRAPHAWLEPGRSVLDLFGHGLVLLDFAGTADLDPLVKVAEQRQVPLAVQPIRDERIAELYERALVLVRPDGHVGWRGDTAPDIDQAGRILDRIRGEGSGSW